MIKKLTKLTTLDNSGVISIKTIQLYPGNLRFGKLGDIIRGTVLTINKVHPWAKISNGRVKYIIGRKSKRGCWITTTIYPTRYIDGCVLRHSKNTVILASKHRGIIKYTGKSWYGFVSSNILDEKTLNLFQLVI